MVPFLLCRSRCPQFVPKRNRRAHTAARRLTSVPRKPQPNRASHRHGKQLILDIVETFTRSAVGAYQEQKQQRGAGTMCDKFLESASRPEHATVIKSLATCVTREVVHSYMKSSAEVARDCCGGDATAPLSSSEGEGQGEEGARTSATPGPSELPEKASRAGTHVASSWLSASWTLAKSAEGRTLACEVAGSVCREGIFAVMEVLGWKSSRADQAAAPANDDRVGSLTEGDADSDATALDEDGASSRLFHKPLVVELTDAELEMSSGESTFSSSPHVAPSPSSQHLRAGQHVDGPTKLDSYKMELVRSSFLFSSSLMMSLSLYYYCSFVV